MGEGLLQRWIQRQAPDMTALLVTRDQLLADELMRLSAAAGTTPMVETSATGALGRWAAAGLVLVGLDMADEVARVRPHRRDGVYIVASGPLPDLAFRTALDLGAEGAVEMRRAEEWLVERLGDLETGGRAPGRLVGVVAGSGGAGASTLACALARVAARDSPSLLVDADPLGPGLDRILGTEGVTGVRWHELEQPTGRLGGASLRDAVPRRDGLGLLTWYPGPQGSLQAFALREVLSAGLRGHELVVVDLPRRDDELTVEVANRCDVLVVVTRPTVVGVASAARVLAGLGSPTHAGVVVRGGAANDGEVATAVGAPVLATLGDHRGLSEAVELGLGPLRSRRGPLYRAATAVLQDVAGVAVAA